MKNLLTIVLLFSTLIGKGQEFMGVKIDGCGKNQAVQRFIQKGFKTEKQDKTWTQMFGMFNNKKVELYLSYTPVTGKFWKVSIYFPKENDWYTIKNDYFYFKKVLTEKYGEPSNVYENFSSPYFEGDGYEMSAIVLEKCDYVSIWLDISILLEISKYKQIMLSYENPILSEINDKEKNQFNSINL
jgi:hypothetical protein